ncbi:MAG: hypothetical protein ACLFSW_02735, partial [Halobacteriales archaeon]
MTIEAENGDSFTTDTDTVELDDGETYFINDTELGPFEDIGSYDLKVGLYNESSDSYTWDNDSTFNVTPSTTTKGERERNRYDSPGDGAVVIGPSGDRPTVFQGEGDIAFYDSDNNEYVDSLTSTDDDNRVIDVPIGENEETGTYTTGGADDDDGVVVQEPEVTNLEAVNVNGEDVNSVTQNNDIAIGVEFNYNDSEPLAPEILDDAGVDVTGQYLLNGGADGTDAYDDAYDDLNDEQQDEVDSQGYDYLISANFDDAGEFELVAEPDGDLADIDSATATEVLDVSSDEDPELELEQNTASQGEEVDAEMSNVEDGDTYYVAIDADDRRDDNEDIEEYEDDVFANAGDTNRTGSTSDYYYAEVEADGTSGLTRIDTEYLDDTGIDVYLYGEGDVPAQVSDYVGDSDHEKDDVSLEVTQAEIDIDSPGETYVPGQEVDLNGTVSEGVDEVSVFVRDRDNYYFVENISVDDDDNTYEETDYDLSDEAETQDARDIVGQPGVYRYGVVDRQDVLSAINDPDSETEHPFVGNNIEPNAGLTSSDFSSGASVQQSLRVAEPSLEGAIETYDEEVFSDDGVDVTGTLIGPRDYLTLFTDSRGTTVVEEFTADREDGEIDEEGIDIAGLSTGDVRASILSPGRDTEFGDGTLS